MACVRIENHSLLANLNFAILKGAGTFIDVQDGTSGGQLGVDEMETAWDRAFGEQALTG